MTDIRFCYLPDAGMSDLYAPALRKIDESLLVHSLSYLRGT